MGDTALLCEVDDLSTVHRLRAAIVDEAFAGVIDVVPGWATVLVVAASPSDLTAVAERLPRLTLPPAAVLETTEHVIGVSYDGPDLDEVARHTGLSVSDVVERHCAATYTVAFLGFQPGFPYLAGLDPTLAVPRKETPRTHVRPGSVGIAGAVSGIYPGSSPSGWQLIGHTERTLFDANADPPAVLAPGDTVRFET
jgi:KipI family sensor histidine kinase inhibitor